MSIHDPFKNSDNTNGQNMQFRDKNMHLYGNKLTGFVQVKSGYTNITNSVQINMSVRITTYIHSVKTFCFYLPEVSDEVFSDDTDRLHLWLFGCRSRA